jgi:hypothetical protein
MPLARHVAALMEALRREDFEILPPAERERFANQCQRCAELARRRADAPERVMPVLAAMLAAASPQDLERLPPDERRRLADTLRHWLSLAESAPAMKSSVPHELRIQRQEWR